MFTHDDLILRAGGQIAKRHLDRATSALNYLFSHFGQKWVEFELVVQYITDPDIIKALGKDRVYSGVDLAPAS
jgi:hypothetical protein